MMLILLLTLLMTSCPLLISGASLSSLFKRNPEINPGLFEGDMVGFDPKKMKPQGVLIESPQWPGGVFVYQIDDTLTSEEEAVLQSAIDTFANKTCIKFKVRTNEEDYVSVKKLSGCFSSIGRIGGVQELSLGDGCWYSGIVQHEFMHALGFVHEQSRPDRDQNVFILKLNIKSGMANNFEKYGSSDISTSGTPYDYGSVMHYGAYDFAKIPFIPVIFTPWGKRIGQRDGMSDTDVLEINKRYNCTV